MGEGGKSVFERAYERFMTEALVLLFEVLERMGYLFRAVASAVRRMRAGLFERSQPRPIEELRRFKK